MDAGDGGDVSWPYLSIGCVVFPVFVLVWYRYSRKHCSNFDGCKDGGFERMENDESYSQSSDRGNDYVVMELTNRLVKWINRQNVFPDIKEYTPDGARETIRADCTDCFCDEREDESSNLFWECIPNTQQQAVELCSTKGAPEDSDSPVIGTESSDTLNSVVVRDIRCTTIE